MGGAYITYLSTKHVQATHATSMIEAVVQTAAAYAPLQTTYFAEVLELSQDRPANFAHFDLDEAYERLMATQVIRKALIKKIKPNILYIDYALRKPIAFLGDYTNTAIDADGNLFPYLPFYSPRLLPYVYVGEKAPPNPWGERVEVRSVNAILSRFEPGEVEQIDLAQSEAESGGKRQIVVILKEGTILRLTPKNYAQELTNYFMLAEQLTKSPRVIDFRNPEVAYIKYE